MPTDTPPLKCPTPFVSTDALSCVMACPADRQFVRQGSSGGGYTCSYTPDPSKSVHLVTVGAVAYDGSTLDELQTVNPAKYAEFAAEKNRFEQAMTVTYASIGRDKQIQDAFQALQSAENVRDQNPSAYQAARTAYYTLLNGPTWINEERNRVAASEVAPEIQRYRDATAAINLRKEEQQKTIDIVNAIKDKVLSLKDDFSYSVNTFSDQLEKVKIQLSMENRSREKEADRTWVWVDVILNVLLVAALVYAVYTMARRYYLTWRRSAAATPVPSFPTYRVATA
jgi:hypothetical protein